jgi:hypothetical protein
MTPTPPSNLGATRVHMAKMKREFAPKARPKRDAFSFTHCVGCDSKLYTLKASGLKKCVNPDCKHYGYYQ